MVAKSTLLLQEYFNQVSAFSSELIERVERGLLLEKCSLGKYFWWLIQFSVWNEYQLRETFFQRKNQQRKKSLLRVRTYPSLQVYGCSSRDSLPIDFEVGEVVVSRHSTFHSSWFEEQGFRLKYRVIFEGKQVRGNWLSSPLTSEMGSRVA